MTDGLRVSSNNFKYAAWYRRLGALVIDKFLVSLLILLIVPGSIRLFNLLLSQDFVAVFNFLGSFDGMWFLIVLPVYFLLMWGFFSRTVGMMLLKIRIADQHGKRIGWMKSVFRLFGFYLSFIVVGLGFLMILVDKKKQGLHDKLTKTIVILKR